MLRRLFTFLPLALGLVLTPLHARAEASCTPINLHYQAFDNEWFAGTHLSACINSQVETLDNLVERLRAAHAASDSRKSFRPTLLLLEPKSLPLRARYFGKSVTVSGETTLDNLVKRLRTAAAAHNLPEADDYALHFIDADMAHYVTEPGGQHWSSPFYALSEAGRRAIDLDSDAAYDCKHF